MAVEYTPNFTPNFIPNYIEKTGQQQTDNQAQQLAVPEKARLNDPYQLNTILDVLFNKAGLKKAYGDSSFKTSFTAVKDIVLNQYWKPMRQGDFSTPFHNTLFGLGEVLDVFGNVPKSLVAPLMDVTADIDWDTAYNAVYQVDHGAALTQTHANGKTTYATLIKGEYHAFSEEQLELYREVVNSGRTVNIAELTAWERVKSSIGFGDYGRINYQINRKNYSNKIFNTIDDMVFEVLIDPTTWVSFGRSALGKTSTKSVDKTLKSIARDIDEAVALTTDSFDVSRIIAADLMDDLGRRALAQQIVDVYQWRGMKAMTKNTVFNDALKDILGEAISTNKLHTTYAVKKIEDALKVVLYSQGLPIDVINSVAVSAGIQRGVSKYVNSMTTSILRNVVNPAKQGMDFTQKTLAKITLTPSGVYPVYEILKHGGPKLMQLIKHIMDTIQASNGVHDNVFGNRPVTSFFDGLPAYEKNAQTIVDALPTDLQTLYRTPSYIRVFEQQATADLTLIDEWYRGLDINNIGEKIIALKQILQLSQKATIEETIQTLNDVIAASTQSSRILEEYRSALIELSAHMSSFKKNQAQLTRANLVEATNTRLENTGKLDSKFFELEDLNDLERLPSESIIAQHVQGTQKLLLAIEDEITRDTFIAAWQENIERTVTFFKTAIQPVAESDTEIEFYANMVIWGLRKLLEDQRDLVIEAFDLIIDNTGVLFKQSQLTSLKRVVLSKKVIQEQVADYLRVVESFTKRATAIAKLDTLSWELLDQPKSILDGYTQMQQEHDKQFRAIMQSLLNNSNIKEFSDRSLSKDLLKKVPLYLGGNIDEVTDNVIALLRKAAWEKTDLESLDFETITLDDLDQPIDRTPVEIVGEVIVDKLYNVVDIIERNNIPLYYFSHEAKGYTGEEAAIAYALDTLIDAVEGLLSTPIDDAGYVEFYNKVTHILENALVTLSQGLTEGETVVIKEIETVQNCLDYLQKYLSPLTTEPLLEAIAFYENTEVIREEMFTQLIKKLMNEDIISFYSMLRSGDLGQLVQNIIDQPEAFTPTLVDGALAMQNSLNAFDSMRQFVYATTFADLSSQTRAAFLQTVMNYMYLNADQLHNSLPHYSDKILERLETYTHYTKQGNRRRNLNMLMQEKQYTAFVDDVYKRFGIQRPKTELHQGLSDIIADFGVLEGMIAQDAELAFMLKDKIIIGFDFEAMNEKVEGGANQIHQVAAAVMLNGKPLGTYSQALKAKRIMGQTGYDHTPDHDYMYSLVDSSFHHTDGTYKPIADYSKIDDAKLRDFYLKHISQGNTEEAADSEAALLLNFVKYIWDTLHAHGASGFNPETFTFDNVVLVGHNVKGYDLELYKNKIQFLHLREQAPQLAEYGMDLKFFDKLKVLDTYEMSQKADDLFEVSPKEEMIIRKLLFDYTTALEGNETATVFDVFRPSDVSHIRFFFQTLEEFNPAYKELLQEPKKAFLDSLSFLFSEMDSNKVLREQNFVASALRDPKNTDHWAKLMKEQLGLTDQELITRFGEDLSNIQLSSTFAAAGHYQCYSYKHELHTLQQDAWFIGGLSRTEIGKLTRREVQRNRKVIRALNAYKKDVKRLDVFASYAAEMAKAVEVILGTNNYPHLRYIRTTGLNVSEQWAVFKYLATKYSPEDFKALMLSRQMNEQKVKDLLELLRLSSSPGAGLVDRYSSMMKEGNTKSTVAYLHQLNDLMGLKKDFEQLSRDLDRSGLFGSAATLQVKASESIIKVLEELNTSLQNKPYYEQLTFHNAERALTERLSLEVTQTFLDATPQDMLAWLAHSHGHVVFDLYTFPTVTAHARFIEKLGQSEYTDLGIHCIEDGVKIWVYLDRTTNLKVHIDQKTNKIITSVHGKAIEAPQSERFLVERFDGVYDGFVNTEELQKAINAFDHMSDGLSRNSTYEMYGRDAFERVYESMPDEMKVNFYTKDSLCGLLFWDATPFNKSVLGTIRFKRSMGLGASSQYVSSLKHATDYRMNSRGMRLVYEQAMLAEANAIQNTPIADLIKENDALVAKWFNENQDYTAAVLIHDKRAKDGYSLLGIDMTTREGVRKALEMNARIVSTPEYNKLYEVINQNIWSETSARGWQTLVRTYKIGYLGNPGTWARNDVDAFIKNSMMTEQNMLPYYAQSSKLISDYEFIIQELTEKVGFGRYPTEGAIKRYFEGQRRMDYKTYKMLHSFFSDPAAGGEAKLFSDMNAAHRKKYLAQLLSEGQITTDEYNKQMIKQGYQTATSWLLSPMGNVERRARLAEYLALTEKGHTTTSALHIVEKTHFSYSTKSKVEQTLELIIPFYTFANRNFTYWMEALDKRPSYFALLRDILEPALNLEQYSQNELENNASLQRNIAAGNIPLIDDYFWSMSFSFMDTLGILVDPLGEFKSFIFSPVQTILNVFLQGASDEAYNSGRTFMSNWMQNAFGTKMTKQQVIDKYGEWASEYEKLYSFKISKEDPIKEWLTLQTIVQLVPLIGSQIQRAINTGVYWDDGDDLRVFLYATGLATKAYRWDDVKLKASDTHQQIVDLLQTGDDAVSLYTQLKRMLGYGDISLSGLSEDVKRTILDLMLGTVPQDNVIPVLQDADGMMFMWRSLMKAYDVEGMDFDEIDKDTLNSMYTDIAKSVVHLSHIYTMLSDDPESRITYSVVKKNLGLQDLKVYQLPIEVLEVLDTAMQEKLYVGNKGSVRTPRKYKQYAQRTRGRTYSKKTYTGHESPGSALGYSGVTPYSTKKGVYANYGHNAAQKMRNKKYTDFYREHYADGGLSRMQMAMKPVTPDNLKYRLKDMFYYK